MGEREQDREKVLVDECETLAQFGHVDDAGRLALANDAGFFFRQLACAGRLIVLRPAGAGGIEEDAVAVSWVGGEGSIWQE